MSFPLNEIASIPNVTITAQQAEDILDKLRAEWGTDEEAAILELCDDICKSSDVFAEIAGNTKLLKLGMVAVGLYNPEDFPMP